jgi:hypothetical protein
VSHLDLPVALARELVHRAGALRVGIAVDLGDAPDAMVQCERLGPILVIEEGGEVHELHHDACADVELAGFPTVRRLPPFEVEPAEGRVAGPLGGLEMLARALRGVAGLIGGRTVVAADFATQDAETPLGLAARAGEDTLVVLLGEESFELDL